MPNGSSLSKIWVGGRVAIEAGLRTAKHSPKIADLCLIAWRLMQWQTNMNRHHIEGKQGWLKSV